MGPTALACVGKDHGLARILGSLQGERRWEGEEPWLLRAVFAIDYFLLLYSPGPYDVPASSGEEARRGSKKAHSGVDRVIPR